MFASTVERARTWLTTTTVHARIASQVNLSIWQNLNIAQKLHVFDELKCRDYTVDCFPFRMRFFIIVFAPILLCLSPTC